MNGFEKRTQEKKHKILEAAVELFSARGIQKVSITEISAKACASQVTIYKYFNSKENLARCALEHYYNELLQSFIDVIDSDLPFAEKIEQAFFAPMQKSPAAISSFWDDAISEKLRDITLEYEQKITPHMLRFIEQGYECGYFNKSYSAETLLIYLNVFGTNAMKQLGSLQTEDKKKRIYEELLSVFLHGVVGNRTKKE
ncbi:TetR/AcrR family transcriptional regulator [Kineothrix sedimenti]|uniref:TetR/AcrR family transcriptional regulator n=1 Tax=Kineothrix sedimenti TaxID=3123317 RepID=A0ABZ3EQG9_9FIRM